MKLEAEKLINIYSNMAASIITMQEVLKGIENMANAAPTSWEGAVKENFVEYLKGYIKLFISDLSAYSNFLSNYIKTVIEGVEGADKLLIDAMKGIAFNPENVYDPLKTNDSKKGVE